MDRTVYLDNAATTPLYRELEDTLIKYNRITFGNPSSLHAYGRDAANAVENSRRLMAKLIGAAPNQIIFTSGSTEANETIIRSSFSPTRNLAITSSVEHASVRDGIKRAWQGESVFIGADADGFVDIGELKSKLTDSCALVSLIYVNNELGSILDIKKVRAVLDEASFKGIFHMDATQAVGKIDVNVEALGVDALSASAHKFHGPKGVGFLFIKNPAKLNPLFHGGGQESGLRSGTQNVAGIACMAKALAISCADLSNSLDRVKVFKRKILSFVESGTKFSPTIDPSVPASPYILSLSFSGLPSEVLLHKFEEQGILLSSASACSSNSNKNSHVIEAIGKNLSGNAIIRLSFSHLTTDSDIESFIKAAKNIAGE